MRFLLNLLSGRAGRRPPLAPAPSAPATARPSPLAAVRRAAFGADEAGHVAATFGLAILPVLGLAGAAVDYSRASDHRTKLQAVTDSAAIRAAGMAAADDAERVAVARAVVAPAGPTGTTVQVRGETVTVTAVDTVRTGMMSIVGVDEITVAARSTASPARDGAPTCVLALNPAASGAVTFTGNSTFLGRGCSIQSNSASASGLVVSGSASVTADAVCSVGGFVATDGISPKPKAKCRAVEDPFAALPRPHVGACDHHNVVVKPNESRVLQKGVYCGGLSIKGQATLAEGTFVLRDGPLTINSQAQVSGIGVTLYLTGAGAGFHVNGGAAIDLRAPTSGLYAGILLFQDPASAPGVDNVLNGGSSLNLNGVVYTPRNPLRVSGGAAFGQATPRFAIVADQVTFTGNSSARSTVVGHDIAAVLPRTQGGARITE